MIIFDNITKRYGSKVALENATIHIDKGDFVFLVGPSGAGKSTFIKLILKEIEPDEGKLIVAGRDITHLSNREI
ncbi:MAG: ATP-binding cassette domain-containing protein, partial [Firmicutes bacterium]|nr:ATP-binding cassette domain-containing protein [Bacillota bacterium]